MRSISSITVTARADCKLCHGEGTYYEDVAGDGGSRMQFDCDCVVSQIPEDYDGELYILPAPDLQKVYDKYMNSSLHNPEGA